MLKYTLPLWAPDRGCVHADSSLKLHLSTEIIMYTERDMTCHLMTMDPITRTASGAKQIRSPPQLTEDLALLQKCFSSSSLSFRRNNSHPKALHSSETRIQHWNSVHSRRIIKVIVEQKFTHQRANQITCMNSNQPKTLPQNKQTNKYKNEDTSTG